MHDGLRTRTCIARYSNYYWRHALASLTRFFFFTPFFSFHTYLSAKLILPSTHINFRKHAHLPLILRTQIDLSLLWTYIHLTLPSTPTYAYLAQRDPQIPSLTEPEPSDAGEGKSAEVDAASREVGDGPRILRARVRGDVEPRTDLPLASTGS
jgi:hypothetical protein